MREVARNGSRTEMMQLELVGSGLAEERGDEGYVATMTYALVYGRRYSAAPHAPPL